MKERMKERGKDKKNTGRTNMNERTKERHKERQTHTHKYTPGVVRTRTAQFDDTQTDKQLLRSVRFASTARASLLAALLLQMHQKREGPKEQWRQEG